MSLRCNRANDPRQSCIKSLPSAVQVREFEMTIGRILRNTAYLCRAPRDQVVRSGRVPGVVEINVVGFLRRDRDWSLMPSVDSRLSLRLEPAEILLIEH